MAVIEGLLAGIAQVVKLLERGEKRREVIFTRFVEEVYKQFDPITQDYVRMFEKLTQSASEAGSLSDFRSAFEEFKEDRKVYELARRQIETLTDTYRSKIDRDDVAGLFDNIGTFFSVASGKSTSLRLQHYFEERLQGLEGTYTIGATASGKVGAIASTIGE